MQEHSFEKYSPFAAMSLSTKLLGSRAFLQSTLLRKGIGCGLVENLGRVVEKRYWKAAEFPTIWHINSFESMQYIEYKIVPNLQKIYLTDVLKAFNLPCSLARNGEQNSNPSKFWATLPQLRAS